MSELLNLSNFSKGLITRMPDTDIPVDAFSNCENIELNDKFVPTKCKGSIKYNNTGLADYPITGGIVYQQVDGTKYYVMSCYNKIYYSIAGSGTFTAYQITVGGSPADLTINSDSTPEFIQYNNNLYITNGKYPIITNAGYTTSRMIKISGTTPTELTDANIPQGAKYLAIHQERLFAANSIDQPNGLYWTEPYAPEDWLPDVGVNYDFVGKDDGENISGIVSYQDYLYVGKPRNIYRYATIGDITQWASIKVDTLHGWMYQRTIKEMDGYLYYLSPLGVAKFDGNNAIIVSQQIRDKFLGLVQVEQNSRQWTQTTSNDFKTGVYGPYNVTGTASSGTTLTLVDATLTQASDYWNGATITITSGTNAGEVRYVSDFDNASSTLTFSTAFTLAIDNTSVYTLAVCASTIYMENNELTQLPQDSYEDWKAGTISHADIETSQGDVQSGTDSDILFGTNIALSKSVTSNMITNPTYFNDANTTNYATPTSVGAWITIDFGANYNINKIFWNINIQTTSSIFVTMKAEYSTDNINWTLLGTYSRGMSGGMNSPSNPFPFIPINLRYLKLSFTQLSSSSIVDMCNIICYEAYSSTSYIITQSLDYGLTPMSLGKLAVEETINTDTSINYQTQTSADNITWDSLVDVSSDGTINSTPKRYLRVKAILNTFNKSDFTPILHKLYVGSVWTSTKKDLGVTPSSWGTFISSYILNNQEVTFWMRSASTEGGLDTAVWYQQNTGENIINIGLYQWIQIQVTLNTNNHDEVPIVYSVQINYLLSNGILSPCAVVWKDNYWINVADSGSTINNIVYQYNKDDYWLIKKNKNNNIYIIDNNYLLSGSSNDDGYVKYNESGLYNDENIVTNGKFTSATTGWTAVDCTLASVVGGVTGNCLQVTRTGNIAQSTYQKITTTQNSSYKLSVYTKSGTSGNEYFQICVTSNILNNLEMLSFDPANSGYTYAGSSGAASWQSNVALDIRGKNTASRLYASQDYRNNYKQWTNLSPNTAYTLSAYIKANNSNYGKFIIGSNNYTPTDEWIRYQSTQVSDASGNLDIGFGSWTDLSMDILVTQVQFEKGTSATDFVEIDNISQISNSNWTLSSLTFNANSIYTYVYIRKFSSTAGTMLFDNVNMSASMDSWFETRNFELSSIENILRKIFITSKSDKDWILSYKIDNGDYNDVIISYSTYTNTIKKVINGIKRGQFVKFKIRQYSEDNNFEFNKLSLEYEPWRTLNNA